MTSIKKSPAPSENENVVALCKKNSNFSSFGLSPAEISYVKNEFEKKDKKMVVLNQLRRIIILQLLEKKAKEHQTLEALRKAGDKISSYLNENKKEAVVIADGVNDGKATLALAEGIALGNYQFIKYKTKEVEKEKHSLATIFIHSKKVSLKDIEQLQIVLDSVMEARSLVNEPVSTLNANALAKEFQRLGKEAGFKVTVFEKTKIEAHRMGGLLAVNQGSIDPPTFTIMEWKPARVKNKKPVVLVGKGVVYDTGGLSLKPTPNSMDYMKCDMAGSAAVGCTMYAIAKAKLPVHVIGLVPATDNRPGGNAYAPGDIINMYDGQKVEMLNADAEGRMILADALAWAKQYNPELVIDLATLTGAAAAAVGTFGMVAMGTASEAQKNKLKASGNNVHERLAEFPFWEEYDDLIKSDIADMKNIGGPHGGAITAGKFLARFTSYPWIHLDIAGPAFLPSRDSYRGKGGTGTGVRLLFDFLKNY
ncbi:MAG: leucyl aminopeptidase [Bacteroidetes bacterium]|nr:leucyl aminopeptidase [Bacteroidota bacterium]